jgi:hypothetical protein
MSETPPKSNSGKIVWFSPVIILWAAIILPSSFHAVWSSLDDGVTLRMAQEGLGACFNMNAGRIVPLYWLHGWLLYQIGGLNPTIWYAIQSFEFLIAALLIYWAIGCISDNWPAGALAAGVALTSAPVSENAYTISKCEPRLMFFLSAVVFLAGICLKAAIIQTPGNRRHSAGYFTWLVLFLAISMMIFTKESGIAIFGLGIVGMAASGIYLKQSHKWKAIKFFVWVSFITLPMVVILILLRAHALRITNYAYSSITLSFGQSLSNLKSYFQQSPDILALAAACMIFGAIHLIRHERKKGEPLEEQSQIAAVMAWSTLAIGLSYLLILLIWRMNMNYYMLPVGVCVSLSLGYFICSTKSANPDRRHGLLRWAVGFLLIGVVVSRVFSIPYLHFVAVAQRGFDIVEDQVFRETLKLNSSHPRILDIGRPYFVEQPYQRNYLYKAIGATDHSWVGARDMIQNYPEDFKRLFGVADPSPLEKAPPSINDLLVVQSGRCPFEIGIRGITPMIASFSSADSDVHEFEAYSDLVASKRQVLDSVWTVFKPWSLKMDKLEFRAVIYECREGLLRRPIWKGRFADGWIGKMATLQISENKYRSPGLLRFRTLAFPWAVPIRITLSGDTIQTIALDSKHFDQTIRIDKVLLSRQGTIQIAASKTWVLKKFQPDSKEVRSLGVLVDYEPGSFLKH